MARSELLRDLVNGQKTLENILLRLKVILSDLDNEVIMNWIQGELQGYDTKEDIPAYRVIKGSPVGTFFVHYSTKYTNAQVPLENLIPQERIDQLTAMYINDSINTLQGIIDKGDSVDYAKVVPTALCYAISTEELQIAGMSIKCSSNVLSKIVANVKSKLVDVIMELEKQYDNLDDLDIKSQVEEDTSKKEQVILNIEQIIFDESIKMGDKNKVKGSRLGHLFGGRK
ncbi:AbiTii domain-containing protein [Bacillus paranthracis]